MFFNFSKTAIVRSVLILVLLVGLLGVMPSAPAYAAALTVTNANDSGAGSLRQAILDAAAGDTIGFDPSLAGQTIALNSQVNLQKDLTIDGSGLTPVVEITGSFAMRIFYVASNSTVTLKSLLLKNGRNNSGSNGGAIYSEGNLTVRDSTFINNTSLGNGGAIYSSSTLDITGSTFVNNSALSGGAVYVDGGLFVNPTTPRSIVNNTFVSNQANVSNGLGGGVQIRGSESTFPGEYVPVLANNTFSGNGASSGGALYSTGGVSILNNIFANSTNGRDCAHLSIGGMVSASHNLIEDGTNCFPGPFVAGDPMLGPLSDNGGPTQTMALLPGSPALDAGTLTCYLTDQRGVTRPQGAACEIGAYEVPYQTVIRYVKWDANGANNGTSWLDAYTDLQAALTVASSGDQIWVAAGTYKPTAGTDRTASFQLKNGVAIYGGFAGTETSRTFLNFETNVTVLSGDIGVAGDNSDNSYHVVVSSNTNEYARLDGFWITAGNANGAASPNDRGGGVYNFKGSPSLTNLLITSNYATFGGGMYNRGEFGYPGGSNPDLTYVIFWENSAIEGGGMRNEDNTRPRLFNVSFSGNTAVRSGGGMENFNHGDPMMTNVTFRDNSASSGGAMMNWGNNFTMLINATLNANSATEQGGAIYNDNGSSLWMMYVTTSGNTALQGGGIYNAYGSDLSLSSGIVYGNTGGEIYDVSGSQAVTYSIVKGGYTGTGNLDADPLLAPLQFNGGFTQTMALGTGSPAIDAGEAAYCPLTDQRDVSRPQGSRCDIGAYEYTAPVSPTPTYTPMVTSTKSATFTPTPTHTNTLTHTPTFTPTNTFTPTATPTYSYNPLLLSLTSNQTIGGVASADEDILRFDGQNWILAFDGSDVGVGSSDLFAFSFLDGYSILMSFNSNVTVNGITATPQDVLRFDVTSFGSTTTGAWSLYFDGSDVGLDSSSEAIDSLTWLPDGRLLISTTGNPSLTGLSGAADEDVLAFTPTTLGSNTSGSWAIYFDGSDVGLADSNNEDVDALDVTPNGRIYLSTLGDFSVNGISGADEDVFVCVPSSTGSTTACNYLLALYFDGSTWGLSGNDVDAFHFLVLTPPSTPPAVTPSTPTPTATASPSPTATFTRTATRTPTMTSTPSSSMFLRVLQPNGGEALNVGSVYRITWDSTPDIDTVTIGYKSCDSCLSWIANNIPNTGYYDWNVFVGNTTNTQFKIYIIGYDTGVGSISDVSDNNFTVLPPPTVTPTFTATATATQPPPVTATPSTSTFTAISDGYVNAGNPTTNYGSSTTLRADADPDVRSYLRFNVQGLNGTVTKATLRVFANSSSSQGCSAHSVSDNTWTESTLSYNNAPPLGGTLGSSGLFGANAWISIDVTSYITGNGTYNLALTTPGSTAVSLASRESGANAPQLIIETAP
jgi:predicted outer membrane repeat protein